MCLSICHLGAFLSIFVAAAAALNIPQNTNSLFTASVSYNLSNSGLTIIPQSTNTSVGAESLPSANLTLPDTTPESDDEQIRCTYGQQLETESCFDALNTFMYSFPGRGFSVGDRDAGNWDLNLPIRWISGKQCSSPFPVQYITWYR